jgi:hypothetical protein
MSMAILTDRPPLVGEISANFLRIDGVVWSAQQNPHGRILGFLDQSFCYFSENLVAPGIEPGTSGSVAKNS